jgi:starvation-inducible DNA-binding protein
MAEFIKSSSLKEAPGKYPTRQQMITELLADHETVIRDLRKKTEESDEKYKDMGTSDFLIDLVREHETIAWTLRRYLD